MRDDGLDVRLRGAREPVGGLAVGEHKRDAGRWEGGGVLGVDERLEVGAFREEGGSEGRRGGESGGGRGGDADLSPRRGRRCGVRACLARTSGLVLLVQSKDAGSAHCAVCDLPSPTSARSVALPRWEI